MPQYISDAPEAPKAIGPYSQAVVAGNMVFLSGQIPVDPATGRLVDGMEAQTVQVMKNIKAVLSHLGLDFNHVVKATIFLKDLSNFKLVNSIYETHLGDARPARSTVAVAGLPLGAEIEIEMIAMMPA